MKSRADDTTASDLLGDLQTTVGRIAFAIGGLALITGLIGAVLVLTKIGVEPAAATAAVGKFPLFEKIMTGGALIFLLGSSILFWEEDMMLAIHLGLSLAMFFFPLYGDGIASGTTAAHAAGFAAIASAGKLYLIATIAVLAIDISLRVKKRATVGVKGDLKYGKGTKVDHDRQNVFLGKCWQLPFCRKFVREKCPIFHSKRTCWRELTGCMCEEGIIRAAVDNKPIPKDSLLAAKMIPRNNKLTDVQKRERCKNCVIYNEHQKHKYRALLPVVIVGYGLLYIALREVLSLRVGNALGRASRVVEDVTVGAVGGVKTGDFFIQFLVFCIVLVALTYTLKILEYAIFKAKI